MDYKLFKLEFLNGVRFGKGNLENTEITFHADTLFSALFIEALKLNKEKKFLEYVRCNELLFSDAFPYKGKQYYIPKPMIHYEPVKNDKRGNSEEKKRFKKMKYIPQEYLKSFIKGEFPEEELKEEQKFSVHSMKVSVGIRGNEEPEPYRVSAFHFQEGNGLYLIVGYQKTEAAELFETLLDSLSYNGIGGKRSAGMGRFEYMEDKVPDDLKTNIQKESKKYILLSAALPEDQEMNEIIEKASYNLLKRSGFVMSETYAEQQMRKRDLYVFAAGSCFEKTFTGRLIEEREGGKHPVFRYEKALFLGVDI